MLRRPLVVALVACALVAGACSHHHQHHMYNEPHNHNSYNTPAHPGQLHDTDDHRDVIHDHEHFGGNE